MKEEYLKIIAESDISIFQNYKIVDDKEISIESYEVKNCIENNIPVKIEILIDWGYYDPIKPSEEFTKINSGWIWEFFQFEGSEKLYNALSKIGYDDDFWKIWLNQSWGEPDYTEIWDGQNIYDEYFFDEIEDAKIYKSVWQIKGSLELLFDNFETQGVDENGQ